MLLNLPGRDDLAIKHVMLDYNGTIAIDGILIDGVAAKINALSDRVAFHVVTADTYGTVAQQLEGVKCQLVNITQSVEFGSKLDYLCYLGKNHTLCVGNGFNDKDVLKQSVLGICLVQDEGLSVAALTSSDIVCKSIVDVFSYIEKPQRLKATLRG